MAATGDPQRYAARLAEASALRNAGRVPEAIAAYRDVLAIEPELPDSWYNLAWLLRRNGEPAEALAAYDEALRRSVSGQEEVWLNKGVIQADDLLDPAAAIAAYEEALKLKPGYLPALLNLGNAYEDLGDREAATRQYRTMLELAPDDYEPLARIANLSRPASAEDAIVREVEVACGRPGVAVPVGASLHFALGKLLDQTGEFDRAFSAYERANQLSAASRPAGIARFDPDRHDAAVQALIDLPAPVALDFPPAAIQPVFILGQFRSGSTLLEQVLSAHSGVTALGELPSLSQIAAGMFSPYPQALARASPAQLTAARQAYLKAISKRRPGLSGVVTDKRPDNFYHVGLILRLFPEAKILHTVRDARDVCLSTFFTHLSEDQTYATDLRHIARRYKAYERLMAHWKALAPDRILDVSYDTLVQDAEAGVRRALDFLGLPFEPACLDFHASAAPVKTASVWQVREPLYQRSSGRWRNYETHLLPLLEVLNG